MKTIWVGCLALITAAALGLAAGAQEKHAPKASSKNAGFDKIKSLCGEWDVKPGHGDHAAPEGTVVYKLTAGDSAVVETLFGGTPHEMVTVYYVDGDDLALTHYCMLGNRPHMRAEKSSGPDKLVFKCQGGENAKIEHEMHMHQATFTFVDPDHLKTAWVMIDDGKAGEPHTFDLIRKKK